MASILEIKYFNSFVLKKRSLDRSATSAFRPKTVWNGSFGIPVSSQKLHSDYFNQLSSATIRNSLANLEKIGLLKSIHTSSGKVPTDNGYRYYVDTLIADSSKTIQEYDNISQKLTEASDNLEDLLQATAYMLGKISRLFGVIVLSKHKRNILNEIELIHL